MSYQVQVPNYDTTTGAPLPAGWVRWVDPDGNEFYYHNESTGETTWDDPTRWKVGCSSTDSGANHRRKRHCIDRGRSSAPSRSIQLTMR